MKMVQALGGSPTPIGSDEVYSSLQQGIDGSENNEFALAIIGHGKLQNFIRTTSILEYLIWS